MSTNHHIFYRGIGFFRGDSNFVWTILEIWELSQTIKIFGESLKMTLCLKSDCRLLARIRRVRYFSIQFPNINHFTTFGSVALSHTSMGVAIFHLFIAYYSFLHSKTSEPWNQVGGASRNREILWCRWLRCSSQFQQNTADDITSQITEFFTDC
jgi:hypothetical protein